MRSRFRRKWPPPATVRKSTQTFFGNPSPVIDGFILSPNVELTSVQTQDDGFRFSDHNPVLLSIRLK